MSSFKPVFQMPHDPNWYDNAQRFATKEEALASAATRFAVWTTPTAYDTHESEDLVTYVRVEGQDHPVTNGVMAGLGHVAQAVTV